MTFSEYARECLNKSRSELRLNKSTEWCAEFVSHVIVTCRPDLSNVTSISCNEMKKLMLDSGLFYEPDDAPMINDIGFIDWNRGANGDTERPLDHVVIITKGYGDLHVDYIDGNSDTSGLVKEHKEYKMTVNGDYPDYYLRLKPDANRASFHKIVSNADIYDTITKLQLIRDSLNDLINEMISKR